MNNSPLAVVKWNSDFCVQHWSKQAEQMFGWQESEVLGQHWSNWRFVWEEDLSSVTRITDRLLDGTDLHNLSQNRNYTKKGLVIDCQWHNSVLRDRSGNLLSILSLVQNVSDRLNTEKELQIRLKQQSVAELRQFTSVTTDSEQQAALCESQRREAILKDIASGISIKTGTKFLPSLVEYLSKTLKVDFAYVGNLIQPEQEKIVTTAVYAQGQIVDNFEYYLAGTPCQNVLSQELCIYSQGVQQLFPDSRLLPEMNAQSFAGMSILNREGKAIGLIAIVDSKPFVDISLIGEVLKIFAIRASTELKRQQAEADLAQSNHVLQAISSVQTQYLTDANPWILFDGMLASLLQLTQSEYGFIGEIHFAADGSPIRLEGYLKVRGKPDLKTHSITNIAGNEEAFYAEAPKGRQFHHLETLFGAVIVTGEPVIANSLSIDSTSCGIPEGHPVNAFLGVPFYKDGKITGMVGMINREGGYDEALVHYLRPFLDTCSRVIEAYQSDRAKYLAEQKIREQAALLDVATDAIMVLDLDNKILFWNQGAKNLYGWVQAEVLNKDAHQILSLSSAELGKIQQLVKEHGKWQGELKQITKAGKSIVVESRWTLVKDQTNKPQSYLVVNTDLTEQKQLEAQFLRTQRLESLGTLAGGIAHDLNNILSPILGFSKLLPLKLPDLDEQTKSFFKIMENNANRGMALVKQILTFSRGLEVDKGAVQIRHLIVEIEQIIRETFPKSIELITNVPKNLWTINADVNQLHQVLINLSVNARDAMPDGGTLTINTENTMITPEYARLHLDATVGAYVLITITDTGTGISAQVMERIFEPFFTTKEIGRGTGLGLSTVIGIVKSHGGFIDVVSHTCDSKGTQFKVFLPASDLVCNPQKAKKIPDGNGELILVVDDEIGILEVMQATLETYNYQVLTANNGMKAIATYVKN